MPQDPDGNEELEREQREQPPRRDQQASERQATGWQRAEQRPAGSAFEDTENEDTGRWVATQRFTLEDELEDTWPNLPPQ